MVKGLNIPDEFKYTFKRLINFVPHGQRNDLHTQKVLLLYLKLGGEKMARQYIDLVKLDFRENIDSTETSEKSNHTGNLYSDRNLSEDEGSKEDD